MLTDHDGHVLSRTCHDRALVTALDNTYLAPGFAFSEREAGTNGLGLALADRAPSLVRGDEHYCTSLRHYTCAAAPVLDPVHGLLLGTINLTTWSQQSANLLLALAETAAGHTSALLLARSHGRQPHPTPRGEVFRISTAQPEPAAVPQLSEAWHTALDEVETALTAGHSVAVTGEAGSGKTALLATALAHTHPHDGVLNARPPDPRDADSWLTLWPPELGKDNTSVIVAGVDTLPAWTATALARLMQTEAQRPLTVTAREASTIPKELAYPIDTVVKLPALRQRPEDIVPLAQHFGRQARGREVQFTPTAARALRTYHWPDNAKQLHRVARAAAATCDVIDTQHLPPEVLCGPSRTLTRIETVERDEIVRCLATPGTTITRAATLLGMSRATIYRKIARYGIHPPT